MHPKLHKSKAIVLGLSFKWYSGGAYDIVYGTPDLTPKADVCYETNLKEPKSATNTFCKSSSNKISLYFIL